MTRAFGLDLYGRRGWRATTTDTGIDEVTATTKWLPTAVLPMHRSEVFQPGMDLELHRRGRGLPWPHEAQVPVMNNPANGIGRLPMAAVLEFLVSAEHEWGRLNRDHVAWRPDGRTEVDIDLRRLIGQAVLHLLPDRRSAEPTIIGFVVPSLLQPAGQQLIVDACNLRGETAFLVPSTIAAAIGWAHSPLAARHLLNAIPGDGALVGHLVVVDAGLGPWVAARIPIFSVKEIGENWLVPVRDPRRHRTLRGPTGWQILTSVAKSVKETWLPYLLQGPWLEEVLSGSQSVSRESVSVDTSQLASGIASLCGLEVGRSGVLGDTVLQAAEDVAGLSSANAGPCLGCVVVGAMSQMRVADATISAILARALRLQLLDTKAEDVVRGAGWAALGYGKDPAWPTWREILEPVDIYYKGKNELGDPASMWLPLIQSKTLAAGSDYRNDKPIRGLALERGSSKVRMILRHENERPGTYDYRAVFTKTVEDFALQEQIPLDVHVHARAGQGFAVVRVTSRQDKRFATDLDWLSMQAATEPEPPKLGYIPRSLQIRADANIYAYAKHNLERLTVAMTTATARKTLNAGEYDDIEDLARSVINGIKRMYAANYWEQQHHLAKTDDAFLYYSAFARDGSLHPSADDKPVRAIRSAITEWLARLKTTRRDAKRVRRLCAYMYWSCPDIVCTLSVQRAALSLTGSIAVDAADMQVLGLATKAPSEYHVVYRLVAHVLPNSKSANNYLRALRDVARLNDDSLSDDSISTDTCTALTRAVINYLQWAASEHKSNVVANCVEAILYMLKRRRYDIGYLGDNGKERNDLDFTVSKLCRANIDAGMPWLSTRCITILQHLRKFLSYSATQSDVVDIVSAAGEGDDEGDEGNGGQA